MDNSPCDTNCCRISYFNDDIGLHGWTQQQIHESWCLTNVYNFTVFLKFIKMMIIHKSVPAFDRCRESHEM